MFLTVLDSSSGLCVIRNAVRKWSMLNLGFPSLSPILNGPLGLLPLAAFQGFWLSQKFSSFLRTSHKFLVELVVRLLDHELAGTAVATQHPTVCYRLPSCLLESLSSLLSGNRGHSHTPPKCRRHWVKKRQHRVGLNKVDKQFPGQGEQWIPDWDIEKGVGRGKNMTSVAG